MVSIDVRDFERAYVIKTLVEIKWMVATAMKDPDGIPSMTDVLEKIDVLCTDLAVDDFEVCNK